MKIKTLLKKAYRLVPCKQLIFSILKSIWVPPHSVYQHLHFTGDFPVKLRSGGSFRIRHYGFAQENNLFWGGLYRSRHKGSLALWEFLCQPGNSVFDIGANTGVYSLIAKGAQPTCEVYAFEPVRRVYEKLVTNSNLNDYAIHCRELALSSQTGTAIIFDEPDAAHTYSVTVNKNLFESDSAVEIEIRTERLDDFIARNSIAGIDLMKIDVETHEPEVLEGMGVFLEKFRPDMLIEILDNEVAERVYALLQGLNYKYFDVNESTGEITETQDLTPTGSFNFLICKPATASRILTGYTLQQEY